MKITKNASKFSYGLNSSSLQFPVNTTGGMSCSLPPGAQSTFHRHHETELFLITSGKGRVHIEGRESEDVVPEDIIYIDPLHGHTIENTCENEDLKFTALYWDNPNQTQRNDVPKDTLIISTPPTPNGDLHLGHLSGPYLGADIYRRYLTLKGVSAHHLTGRDDNQTYVKCIATKEQRPPEEVANDYADKIYQTWAKADIALDFFSSPQTTKNYYSRVNSIIGRLYDRGFIFAKEVDELYDLNTGFSLHEGYIKGVCPHCHSASDGNACEQCGRPNDCADLINPVASLPETRVGTRTTTKLYFRLSALAPQLTELTFRSNMSARARELTQGMLSDGLPDICISHRSDWGISVDIPGFEDQVLYVWFEMAAGYLAADEDLHPQDPFFKNKNCDIIHFYGFDNTYYHTLLFPAIYYALDEEYNVPVNHVINELLYLRGEKFSTSRRHLIWASKLLSKIPVDYVRWGLARSRPEMTNENFSLEPFVDAINDFFVSTLQQHLTTSCRELSLQFQGKVPEPGAWTSQHAAFYQRIRNLARDVEHAYHIDAFSPQTATAKLEEMGILTRKFFNAQSKHETQPMLRDYQRTTFALNFWAIKQFSLLSQPIMLEGSEYILKLLGLNFEGWDSDREDFIANSHTISACDENHFRIISKDIIEHVCQVN
ncbi:class I tRNA ligase family protein [Erwinia pyrifoliae]|uniref:Class I tRNA ligase family protein n=1 Tax=Erwinia pyrifoliae TaxID=79967 RepID=A0ABY5X9L0_ERWPY|nr:class I tRNA ligase family protein [Erwinia pyrifoliae]MCT2385874.1 class I tRNA ligase family protein [Erwinia pyrifoliae]MCU8588549.1 class I tRNA ligase family protein [Erwinia pyrifoliae]UWS29712.1 class I tRNA ligase family protein [Erwinia pyrifoliae]UWS34027.1 class I tRNA ligase family protein [Erwinia pyrifoliae]